jgi:hypothetical protein
MKHDINVENENIKSTINKWLADSIIVPVLKVYVPEESFETLKFNDSPKKDMKRPRLDPDEEADRKKERKDDNNMDLT